MTTEIISETRLSPPWPLSQKTTQYNSAETGLKMIEAIINDTRLDSAVLPVCEKDSAAKSGVIPAAIGRSSVRTAKATICITEPAKATPAKANIRMGPAIVSFSSADPSTVSALEAPKLAIIQSAKLSEAYTAPTTNGGISVPNRMYLKITPPVSSMESTSPRRRSLAILKPPAISEAMSARPANEKTMFLTPCTAASTAELSNLKSVQKVMTVCSAWAFPSSTARVKSPTGSPQNFDVNAPTADTGCSIADVVRHMFVSARIPNSLAQFGAAPDSDCSATFSGLPSC